MGLMASCAHHVQRGGSVVTKNAANVLLLAFLVSCVGCGSSDYNNVVNRGVARIRAEAKFQGLYAPTPIPETELQIRVPVIFIHSYTPTSSHPDDGDTINRDRVRPPFLRDDALKLTYESSTPNGAGDKLPYYLYIAVNDSKPGDMEKLSDLLIGLLKSAVPDVTAQWEEIDADTPEGKAIHWRKLRATVEQDFLVKTNAGQIEKRKLPGIFEIWLHDTGKQLVMLGWRAPSEVEGPQNGEFLTVGGMAVPTENAKPDFSKWPVLTAGTLVAVEATP